MPHFFPRRCTRHQMAKLLGISVRQIHAYALRGIISQVTNGRYDPVICIPSILAWWRQRAIVAENTLAGMRSAERYAFTEADVEALLKKEL